MKNFKGNAIFLFKQDPTQADRRDIKTPRSRSRLRDDLVNASLDKKTQKLAPVEKSLCNRSHSKPMRMQDCQFEIQRGHSPLYQRSTQQSKLFQKGLKKPQRNINLESRINLTQKSLSPLNDKATDLSPRYIRRQDPNRQADNILELGAKPLLSNKSAIKRDPNVESGLKEDRKQKSQLKDRNHESTETADYFIKALSTHVGNTVKSVHLKFTKKQNILNKENLTNQANQKPQQAVVVKQHKRHYSHLAMNATKQNIETKQNGISVKQAFNQKGKHERKLFNHDFYKNQNRVNNPNKENSQKQKGLCRQFNTLKTARQQHGSKNVHKNENQSGTQCMSRMAQLRKRFL